ncbi:hypothetical protein [Macrococcus carouselicus]|uniref:Uncharacterized protein n=1 Tax=Macrococcus carouselicus TaxID=69969 RepID=A0A9Q8CFZ0_9STAP|nr:hypothetical protein [Macrococcus carouselicus]TDM02395.1 hypothetical protein ERX40_07515 [Macrococcus carouselicus]
MKINRFEHVTGTFIEEIAGQRAYGYSRDEMMELYEAYDAIKTGPVPGNTLTFYERAIGRVYMPFSKEKNIVYSSVIYHHVYYYFLQCDFNQQMVYLYQYEPGQQPQLMTVLSMHEIDMNNLSLMGENVHITSQGRTFQCYYPRLFSLELENAESVIHIEDDKVYISQWIEEGLEDIDDYHYYEKLIIKDFMGNTLSEEVGNLFQDDQGEWWLS